MLDSWSECEVHMDDLKRRDLKGGYFTFTTESIDPRDPPSVMLMNPDGQHLFVAFASDAFIDRVQDVRVIEGLRDKIDGVKKHLADLEKALSVLSEVTPCP